MKKILIVAFSIFSIFLAGCLKDSPNVDFSKNGSIAELEYPAGANNNGLGSGMEFFGGGALLYPLTDVADTVTFFGNIASTSPPGKDIKITVHVDPTATATYNANNPIQYVPMPDSDFAIISTSGTVKAGSRLATFQIVVFPSKIDPTQNYMLPVSISDASGVTISGNFSIIYLHTIGNPLAGPYFWDWTRWNNTDSTGPNSGTFTHRSTIFLPDNPTTVEVRSGYYIQPHYVLTFTNTAGVLSNFAVTINATDAATMAGAGITVTDGPNIIKADGVAKYFEFQYKTSNGRYVIDRYYK
jgi:hypothetical protein